jgi:hypothetical protein
MSRLGRRMKRRQARIENGPDHDRNVIARQLKHQERMEFLKSEVARHETNLERLSKDADV